MDHTYHRHDGKPEYEEGRQAFAQGVPKDGNPYDQWVAWGHPKWNAFYQWLFGWEDAEREWAAGQGVQLQLFS